MFLRRLDISVNLNYVFLSVRFHLGHLFEMQNKCDLAQEMYETIIETPNTPNAVRANAYKQLGKYTVGIVFNRVVFTCNVTWD